MEHYHYYQGILLKSCTPFPNIRFQDVFPKRPDFPEFPVQKTSYRAIKWPDKLYPPYPDYYMFGTKRTDFCNLNFCFLCDAYTLAIISSSEKIEKKVQEREGGGVGGGSQGSKRKINTAPSTEGGLVAFPQTLNPICKLPPKPVSCSTNLILILFGGKFTLNKEANINNCDDVCTEFAES